jgi:hypothetical protein
MCPHMFCFREFVPRSAYSLMDWSTVTSLDVLKASEGRKVSASHNVRVKFSTIFRKSLTVNRAKHWHAPCSKGGTAASAADGSVG